MTVSLYISKEIFLGISFLCDTSLWILPALITLDSQLCILSQNSTCICLGFFLLLKFFTGHKLGKLYPLLYLFPFSWGLLPLVSWGPVTWRPYNVPGFLLVSHRKLNPAPGKKWFSSDSFLFQDLTQSTSFTRDGLFFHIAILQSCTHLSDLYLVTSLVWSPSWFCLSLLEHFSLHLPWNW